jgi:NADPH:quinone reductase-like Zn-dependent oxidoreductase
LCRVVAGGLNPVDCKYLYGDKLPSVFLPIVKIFLDTCTVGIDFSGIVVAAPKESGFREGDKVFGTMPPSYGSFSGEAVEVKGCVWASE